MEFVVRTKDGSVEGPVDQETLKKWVELDKIVADTPVRNAMLANWKEARDIEFLRELLDVQTARLEAEVEANKGFIDRTLELIGFGNDAAKRKALAKEKSSAFKYEFIPNPASVPLRTMAALFDLLLIGALALVLFFAGVSTVYSKALLTSARNSADAKEAREASELVVAAKAAAAKAAAAQEEAAKQEAAKEPEKAAPEKKEPPKAPLPEPKGEVIESYAPGLKDDVTLGCRLGTIWTDKSLGTAYACINPDEGNALWCERNFMNSTFYTLFAAFVATVLLYYGIALGVFAQTFGMWYWGIFIVKPEELEEVFPLRAYIFAILGIFLGFLTPFMSYVTPNRRTAHDLIAGVRVIRISAKPKS